MLATAATIVLVFQLAVYGQDSGLRNETTYHLVFFNIKDTVEDLGTIYIERSDDIDNDVWFLLLCEDTSSCKCMDHLTSSPYNTTIVVPMSICSSIIPSPNNVSSPALKAITGGGTSQHLYVNQGHDSFRALPDNLLGTDYYVLTFWSVGYNCQLAVTPVQNATHVEIYFSRPVKVMKNNETAYFTSDVPSHTSIPFTLNEYDVLYVESEFDLSSTRLTSNDTIAVFVGAKDENGIITFNEQLQPVNKWGQKFVIRGAKMLFDCIDCSDNIVRIISSLDNTRVQISGKLPFTIKKAGFVHDIHMKYEASLIVRADKPVLLLYVSKTNPGMTLVPPAATPADLTWQYSLCPNGTFMGAFDWINCYNSQWLTDSSTYKKPHVVEDFVVHELKIEEVNSTCPIYSAINLCDQKGVISLLANWPENNMNPCQRTFGLEQDGVDNNCDGYIDEDTCGEQDRVTTVHVDNMTTHSFAMGNLNNMEFTIYSCGTLQLTFLGPANSSDMQIGNGTISHDFTNSVSLDECYELLFIVERSIGTSDNPYDTYVTYSNTKTHPDVMELVFFSRDFDVETLLFTGLIGATNITFDLMTKDCGKVYDGELDNYGKKFIVPQVERASLASIFVTSGDHLAHVTSTMFNTTEVPPRSTKKICLPLSTIQTYPIFIEASSEVTVFLVYDSEMTISLIPIDVMSTQYLLTWEECIVYSLQGNSRYMSKNHTEQVIENYVVLSSSDFMFDKLLRTDKPVAVFCRHMEGMLQVPPLETLGTDHYLPAPSDNANGYIVVTAVNDHTVIEINKEWSLRMNIESAGEHTYIELLVTLKKTSQSPIFITASRPVLVVYHNYDTNNLLHVPSVEQYRHQTSKYSPFFGSMDGIFSSDSGILQQTKPTGSFQDIPLFGYYRSKDPMFRYEESCFTGTVFVGGDVYFHAIAQVCTMSHPGVGDMIDNDCDGFSDEETCFDDEDWDIDGLKNEDCGSAISYTIEPSPELVLHVEDSVFRIVEEMNAPWNISVDSSFLPNAETSKFALKLPKQTETPPPHLEPVVVEKMIFGPGIDFMTSKDKNNSSVCYKQCICPCSWVKPKNYTELELIEKVKQLQQKLIRNKNETTNWLRRRTSARDHRVSARAIGGVGLAFLICSIASIVLLDIHILRTHGKIFLRNIRVFRKRLVRLWRRMQ